MASVTLLLVRSDEQIRIVDLETTVFIATLRNHANGEHGEVKGRRRTDEESTLLLQRGSPFVLECANEVFVMHVITIVGDLASLLQQVVTHPRMLTVNRSTFLFSQKHVFESGASLYM